LVHGKNDNGDRGKDRRCEMNKELLNLMKSSIPLTFALGVFGLVFWFGSSFKIQECYSKVNLVSNTWNFSKPIILNECNSASFYNSALLWVSVILVGITVLNLAISYYYKGESE
jgi:FtsH-binding integral membrane protein